MADFVIGSPLRKPAREHRFLRQLLWRLDYLLVWTLVKMARLLPVDAASRFGQHVGTWVGARLSRKTAIFKENMRIASPELGEEELALLVQPSWGRAGRVMAEYPHLDRILSEPDRLLIDIREPIRFFGRDKLSTMIRAQPEDWFCSKRIWSKTTNMEQTEEAGSEADTDSYAV